MILARIESPFYTTSLHPCPEGMNELPMYCAQHHCSVSSGLVDWLHGGTPLSPTSQSFCFPLSILAFEHGAELWLEIQNSQVVLTEHLLQLPPAHFGWGPGPLLDLSDCSRVTAKGQYQLQSSLALHLNREK